MGAGSESGADLDNMAKSTLDGLVAIAHGDDRQIADLTLRRTSLRRLSIEDPPPNLLDALHQRAIDDDKISSTCASTWAPDHTKLP